MPQTAAGWRIDPPVSVPMPRGASNAATAAEEPPDDPPGTRLRSQGLRDGPNAEFSVDDPIANSSMFALPRITTPPFLTPRGTVAPYGARQPSRLPDPHLLATPLVV